MKENYGNQSIQMFEKKVRGQKKIQWRQTSAMALQITGNST